MKQCLLFISLIVMPGCLMETLTVTAIQGELAAQNASAATRALSHAKDTKAKTELTHALQIYKVEKGHNPATLEELVPEYLPALPMQANGETYGYNPETGEVFSGLRPSGSPGLAVPAMTHADQQNVEFLRSMVYQYWQTTGSYPESLSALVPGYVTSLPNMSNGLPFSYDTQSGMVYHPAEMAPAQGVPSQGVPVQSTPIGNNPVGLSDQHTQRQNNVMDQLGL